MLFFTIFISLDIDIALIDTFVITQSAFTIDAIMKMKAAIKALFAI